MADLRVDGLPETKRALQAVASYTEAEVKEAVRVTALGIMADAVRRIQRGPATGRLYQRYKPRRQHRASAPGEAPQSDTGRLAGSVQVDNRGEVADVGTNLDYGEYLEHGTTKMAARPWLFPAAKRWQRKFQQLLERAIQRAGQRASR